MLVVITQADDCALVRQTRVNSECSDHGGKRTDVTCFDPDCSKTERFLFPSLVYGSLKGLAIGESKPSRNPESAEHQLSNQKQFERKLPISRSAGVDCSTATFRL